jgi:predicted amidohydrolase
VHQRYTYTVTAADARLEPLLQACRRHRIAAVVGTASRHEHRLYVSSAIIDAEGQFRGFYHKRFLFHSERAIYHPGQSGIAVQLGDWRFGLAICYDTGFPEHAREAALQGCHVYLASALFSQGNGYHESRVWFPARALDNTMFTALSNHVGTTGGWTTCGSSAIWSPYGTLLAEAAADKPQLAIARLDPQELHEVRKRETMLADMPERIGNAAAGGGYTVIPLGGYNG